MHHRHWTFAFLVGVIALGIAPLHAAPPRVARTSPDDGAKNVDQETREIVITFDQPMRPGGRSIVGGGTNFPEIQKITWRDERTIVLDVKLVAEHGYALSINSARFTNFRNLAGEPAVPYPISFTTAPAKDTPRLSTEVNKQAIAQLHKFIDDDYSYSDLRKLDWDRIFAEGSIKLENAGTPVAFASSAGEMLAVAQDIHMYLRVGDQTFPTARRNVPANMNLNTLPRLVPSWKLDQGVATCKFEDGVTYILISSWSTEIQPALERVFAAIGEADASKGLIIDVRNNAGGDEELARSLAGCFVATSTVYSKHTTRRDGVTSEIMERRVSPNRVRPAYRGKVTVLIGRYCMSSNESFILMMKTAGATLIGQTTYGSSGNPHPHELSNGVVIILPSWRDLRPDGTCLEGEGISPDIRVEAEPADFERADPVVEAALKKLKG